MRHEPLVAVAAAAAALVVALLGWAAWGWAGLPTVYRAWPSRDCRVVEPAGDCAAPPRLHHVVWVHPAWSPPTDGGRPR